MENTDSDLEREIQAQNKTQSEQETDIDVNSELLASYKPIRDSYTNEANSFIGGSAVISRSESAKKRQGSSRSLFEEEPEFVEDDEQNEEAKLLDDVRPQKKIFTFSLPFGGKNPLPVSPLNSLKALWSNDQTVFIEDDDESKINDNNNNNNKNKYNNDTENTLAKKLDREEIKLKLKRQESITSIEERFLFANNKKMQNVRSKAVKNALKPDTLINVFKSLSTSEPIDMTDDGYSMSRLETVWDEISGDIVILGGYRGSILRNAETKKRVWIPIKAGFNIKKINLLLGPEDEDELRASETIIPDGMLTHIGPVDIARRLIKRLAMNPNVNIEDFGYDWRLSLDITASQLREKLQALYDKQKVKVGTYVIVHSMGGLLAHKVLQDATHLIRGIIYVGAPSQCPNILGPLRFGDEVILNKSILKAETNFFMRSSFYFLPIDGRCFVNRKTFERYDLDYFDPEVWKEYGLSPLVNKDREEKTKDNDTLKESLKMAFFSPVKMIRSSSNFSKEESDDEFQTSFEDSYRYLTKILKRTKKFMDQLQYDPSKKYPPLAIVYGDKVPTVRGAKVQNRDEIKKGYYQDFYYGAGDGVVHHKWLLPETRGFPVVAKVSSEMPHVSLMTDFEAIAKAFISILDAEQETHRKT